MYCIGFQSGIRIIPVMELSGEQVKEFDLADTGSSLSGGIRLYAIGREQFYLGTIYLRPHAAAELVLELQSRRRTSRITPLKAAAAALYSLLLAALVFFLCPQTFAALSLENLLWITL